MPNINKVVYGNNTLIDLTGTTATADKIMEGYGAFGRDGAWMDGSKTIELQAKTVNPTTKKQIIIPDPPDGVTVSDTLSAWEVNMYNSSGTTQELVMTIKTGMENWVTTFPNIFHFYLHYGEESWSNREGWFNIGEYEIDTVIKLSDSNFHVDLPFDDNFISAMWLAPSTNNQGSISLFITYISDISDSTLKMVIVDKDASFDWENGWDTTAYSNAFRLYGLDEDDMYDGLSQVTINPINNVPLSVTPQPYSQWFDYAGYGSIQIAVFSVESGEYLGDYYYNNGLAVSGTYEPNGDFTSIAEIYSAGNKIMAGYDYNDNFIELDFTYDSTNQTAHAEDGDGLTIDIENDIITMVVPIINGYSSVSVAAIPSDYVQPQGSITINKAGSTDVTYYKTANVNTASINVVAGDKNISNDINIALNSYNSSDTEVTVNVHDDSDKNRISVAYSVANAGFAAASGPTGSKNIRPIVDKNFTIPAQPAATITPSTSSQTAITAGKFASGNVTVAPIPSEYIVPTGTINITQNGTVDVSQYANATIAAGSATTPATTITANPSISVSNSGLITASVSASQGIVPDVNAGYISTGTAGTVTASGSNTQQLTTKGATTYTPTTTNQTIASGTYLTGAQTISGDSNLVASNIKSGVEIFGVTGTYQATTEAIADRITTLQSGGDWHDVFGVDLTEDTVTADKLLSGYTAHDSAGNAITGTYVSNDDNKTIKFIDYDGTILHEYTPSEFAQLSDLPRNPSHTGLTAQGWNWTKEEIASQLNDVGGYVIVGQMYITTSGKTEIDVAFVDADYLSPYIYIAPNGTAEIDWGDNSPVDNITGVGASKYIQHNYSQIGNYTIKLSISGTNSKLGFFGGNNGSTAIPLLFYPYESGSSYRNRNRTYAQCVKAIRIGENVELGAYAFRNLTSLQTITIPYGTSITSSAASSGFGGYNYSLKSLTIPKGFTHTPNIGFSYMVETVSIPKSVTTIAYNTYQHAYRLKYATIPYGVTTISSYCMAYCISIKSIAIPNTVTTIGASSLSHTKIESIDIPSSVTKIDSQAFEDCINLKSINIPDSVTTLGDYAFRRCQNLETIRLPSGITSIGTYTFQDNYMLRSLEVPSGVTTIGRNAMDNCRTLETFTIPNNVTTIEQYTFYGCDRLRTINIPNTVTTIGQSAFNNMNSLLEINIPSGVTAINASTFVNCWSLFSLTIPSTVTSIRAYAFQYCYGMQEYHFQSITPPTLANTNAFQGIVSGTKIYVPRESLEAYQTATNWSTYASYMVGE